MDRSPGRRSGPHKVDVRTHAVELFELEKTVMASSEKLYQFGSIEEFVKCLTEDYKNAETYIWNSEEGQLVGLFTHCDFKDERDTDELLLIIVHPQRQGKGYGRKMMEFYLGLIKDKKKSVLYTHENNDAAIQFYESLGYALVKKAENIYKDGQTRVLMARVL